MQTIKLVVSLLKNGLHLVGVGNNRIGKVESMLLQAQTTGTIVAKNLSASTSSTPSAITRITAAFGIPFDLVCYVAG